MGWFYWAGAGAGAEAAGLTSFPAPGLAAAFPIFKRILAACFLVSFGTFFSGAFLTFSSFSVTKSSTWQLLEHQSMFHSEIVFSQYPWFFREPWMISFFPLEPCWLEYVWYKSFSNRVLWLQHWTWRSRGVLKRARMTSLAIFLFFHYSQLQIPWVTWNWWAWEVRPAVAAYFLKGMHLLWSITSFR